MIGYSYIIPNVGLVDDESLSWSIKTFSILRKYLLSKFNLLSILEYIEFGSPSKGNYL